MLQLYEYSLLFEHFNKRLLIMTRLPLVNDLILRESNKKRSYAKQLFSIVAPKYDCITKLMSLNFDRQWKNYLISKINPDQHVPLLLDIASGTGDIVFQLRKKFPKSSIIASDLSTIMLQAGNQKNSGCHTLCNDMCKIPIVDSCIDCITGGYALRNAPDIQIFIKEVYRVLKPGGNACFLEFSLYKNRMLQKLELFILFFWGSLLGYIFHRNSAIYAYIAKSLKQYPNKTELRNLINKNGFQITEEKFFFFGIIAFIEVKKVR
jgi:demethylmenaquinone methyltransferase/2-methoxy-6-polyprenyl-1,4-benzoquinol methylase